MQNKGDNVFMHDGWESFEKSGKITDYLLYKASTNQNQIQNVTEATSNATQNAGIGNQAT